ncbi:hypothetical protein X975_15194, partial [Stegodyphus mimosarum]
MSEAKCKSGLETSKLDVTMSMMSSSLVVQLLTHYNKEEEVSVDEDSENLDNTSDVDESEVIEHSDHESDSEIEGNASKHRHFPSSNDVPSINDDFSDVENDIKDLKYEDFFIKTIYKKKKVGGKFLKEEKETYKWNKNPLKSKFARTPRKNFMKKIFPSAKNCDDIKDERSAFQKIVNTNMIDAIVQYTNIYLRCNRTADDLQNISKRSMYDTNRAEILAFLRILFLLGCKKMSKLNLEHGQKMVLELKFCKGSWVSSYSETYVLLLDSTIKAQGMCEEKLISLLH